MNSAKSDHDGHGNHVEKSNRSEECRRTNVPFVKICGITNAADAKLAIECGAHFLGLIFVKSSPRAISDVEAALIKGMHEQDQNRNVKLIGVFKDADFEYIHVNAVRYGLDYVQCHGSETSEFCDSLPFPVIKAVQISHDDGDVAAADALSEAIEQYKSAVQYILIDRPKDQSGRADWLEKTIALVKQNPPPIPYFIAGGLTHKNVPLVLKDLEPFGVDVASGVESEPGKKDSESLKQFFTAIDPKSKKENQQ